MKSVTDPIALEACWLRKVEFVSKVRSSSCFLRSSEYKLFRSNCRIWFLLNVRVGCARCLLGFAGIGVAKQNFTVLSWATHWWVSTACKCIVWLCCLFIQGVLDLGTSVPFWLFLSISLWLVPPILITLLECQVDSVAYAIEIYKKWTKQCGCEESIFVVGIYQMIVFGFSIQVWNWVEHVRWNKQL